MLPAADGQLDLQGRHPTNLILYLHFPATSPAPSFAPRRQMPIFIPWKLASIEENKLKHENFDIWLTEIHSSASSNCS